MNAEKKEAIFSLISHIGKLKDSLYHYVNALDTLHQAFHSSKHSTSSKDILQTNLYLYMLLNNCLEVYKLSLKKGHLLLTHFDMTHLPNELKRELEYDQFLESKIIALQDSLSSTLDLFWMFKRNQNIVRISNKNIIKPWIKNSKI
jgi:hypothetical protein